MIHMTLNTTLLSSKNATAHCNGLFRRLLSRKTDQEEAYRDLRPHQGEERLNPFAVGILSELVQLMTTEVRLAAAETVMHFDEIEACANGIADLWRKKSQHSAER